MIKRNKKNTKKIAVMQVLPHLNSGGLVSGALEVAKELNNNSFKSVVVSSGGYKENELLSKIIEKSKKNDKPLIVKNSKAQGIGIITQADLLKAVIEGSDGE